jgi:hypothetical protein
MGQPWMDDTELIGVWPPTALVLKGTDQGGGGGREPIPGLTERWAATRWPGDKAVRWWSGALGGGVLRCGRGEPVRGLWGAGFFGGPRGRRDYRGRGGGERPGEAEKRLARWWRFNDPSIRARVTRRREGGRRENGWAYGKRGRAWAARGLGPAEGDAG